MLSTNKHTKVIKASSEDKAKAKALLHAVKDAVLFEEKIEVINKTLSNTNLTLS